MFGQYIYEFTHASNAYRMLLLDEDDLEEKTHYSNEFINRGFKLIYYEDDLHFRIKCEDYFKDNQDKYLIIAKINKFIPYDICKLCGNFRFIISVSNLFPHLNSKCINERDNINFDLLSQAYRELFENCRSYSKTENFIKNKVYSRSNVNGYVDKISKGIEFLTRKATTYRDWIKIAEKKSVLDVYSAAYGIETDVEFVQNFFLKFVLKKFGQLSGKISSDEDTPVLVKGAMDYMYAKSKKFVIIVMDGMSEFDWNILSCSFTDINYERSAVFAMIPTFTSLSRQSLVSGKYPRQLMSPWSTSKEKKEFINCALELGFRREQIEYHRGYDANFDFMISCGCIIINDIDNIVHGQQQGRAGMYHEVKYLSHTGKLVKLVRNLLQKGFDVFISADHGNTFCTGQGKLKKLGVETETKSHRMLVLEKFANKDGMIEQYDMIEYPKYFLNKQYDYLICNFGKSFDSKGEKVMTHGGITVDEVIVPFIKIKAVNNIG